MTRADTTSPVAAFGDPEAGLWGVVVGGPDPGVATGALGAPGAPRFAAGSLTDAGADWALDGEGVALTISPAPPGAATADLAGAVELCRVTGRLTTPDGERELDIAGARWAAVSTAKLDSLRLVFAWFPVDSGLAGLALLATRPQGARGQDRDAVAVALAGEPETMTIFDPRLSTTYAGDGSPSRMGVELWLGETEEGDQYPRRAAGEATGATVTHGNGVSLAAYPMRCHARGSDGVGVYVMVRPS
jgi:hypothetical protein